MSVQVHGDEEYWPGPVWDATVFDRGFPSTGANPGDLYIGGSDGDLLYIFEERWRCELIDPEVVLTWYARGWMNLTTQDLMLIQRLLR